MIYKICKNPYSVFFIFLILIVTLQWDQFSLPSTNPDEDFDITKPYLMQSGYHLYSEIWNDQPPFYSYLIEGLFWVFGSRLWVPKLLQAIFSVALLTTMFLLIFKITDSRICGYFASMCLLFSPHFLELTPNVFIGLPALTLAFIGLYQAILFKLYRKPIHFFLCCLMISFGIGIKLMSILVVPWIIIIMTIPLTETGHNIPVKYYMYSAILLLLFALPYFIYNDQLIAPHAGARDVMYGLEWKAIVDWLLQQPHLLILLALKFFNRSSSNKFYSNLFMIWFTFILGLFLFHRPIWHHYAIYLSLPLILTCTLTLRNLIHLKYGIVKLIFLVFILLSFIQSAIASYTYNQNKKEKALVIQKDLLLKSDIISDFHPQYIFTDRPILSFLAKTMTIPELCVFSLKRLDTANLTDLNFKQLLIKYKPELIILNKTDLKFFPLTQEHIHKCYAPLKNSPGILKLEIKTNA